VSAECAGWWGRFIAGNAQVDASRGGEAVQFVKEQRLAPVERRIGDAAGWQGRRERDEQAIARAFVPNGRARVLRGFGQSQREGDILAADAQPEAATAHLVVADPVAHAPTVEQGYQNQHPQFDTADCHDGSIPPMEPIVRPSGIIYRGGYRVCSIC